MRARGKAPLRKLQSWADRLWLNVQGQDLIEYALLAGFVAVIIGATIPGRVVPPMARIYQSVENLFKNWGS
jgi:Flp pilus assembly pilin Flp